MVLAVMPDSGPFISLESCVVILGVFVYCSLSALGEVVCLKEWNRYWFHG